MINLDTQGYGDNRRDPSPFDRWSADSAIAVRNRSSTDELGVDSNRW
jgi:hypothetical protein